MNEHLEEDWLDARLREEAPYIDDAGFTALVVQKLPAQHAGRTSFRGVLLLAITLLACVVTYFVSDGGRFVVSAAQTLSAMPLWLIMVIVLTCTGLGTIAAAGIAFFQAREQPLG
jgi:hypothetical protein